MTNEQFKAEVIKRLKPLEWQPHLRAKSSIQNAPISTYSYYRIECGFGLQWDAEYVEGSYRTILAVEISTPDLAKAACEQDRLKRVLDMLRE